MNETMGHHAEAARRDGLYLVALGALVFVLFGAAIQYAAPAPLADFRAIYFPSKTLIEGRDPFDQAQVMRIYKLEEEVHRQQSPKDLEIATVDVYPPSTLFVMAPLALVPARYAGALWTMLTFAVVIMASILVWELSANYSPRAAGALIGLLLVNGILLAVTGNVAGVAIGLTAIAVWCFVHEKYIFCGVLGMALALALKPHDTGLIWLALLSTGVVLRRRALQSLLAALVLSAPGMIWTWLISPQWMREWGANLAAFSVRGGINDPGLSSSGGHGLDALISLQTVFSLFKDDPHFYNPAAALVCLPLLLLAIYHAVHNAEIAAKAWLTLAVVAPLSLLPIYHRQVDALVLLLAIPGCAVVQSCGGLAGRISVAISTAAVALTGVFCWASVRGFISAVNPKMIDSGAWWSVFVEVASAPLILLLMSAFFLRQQSRRS